MAWSRKACPAQFGRLLLCACSLLSPAIAQKVVSARAGLISYLQGAAFVDGKRVVLKIARFQQMKDGETLSTRGGRAELLLAPGIVLRLAENSEVRMENTDLADTRVTLRRGDALIEVVQLVDGNRVQVALGETTAELSRPGLYRFGITPNEMPKKTLRVFGGEALVQSGSKTAEAKRGMAVDLDPELPVSKFDRKQMDSLHAWAARRSFELFMSDPDARQKQNHWQPSGAGYVANKNFGVEYRAFIRRAMQPPSRPPVPPAEHP
jgi:hypothetical protein